MSGSSAEPVVVLYAIISVLNLIRAATGNQCKETNGAFPLHGTVRFGTARYGTVWYGTVRYGSVRVGLHFHRSLVPL